MLHKIRDSKGNIICLCGSKVYKEIMNISKEKLDDFLIRITMSKTYKHQDTYNYINNNKSIPKVRLRKLLHYFDRINFWDWDLKILSRKHKDFVRGGIARIKKIKYK